MDKKIDVKCECEGTGFIAVADDGGEGVEHVECGQHHPAFCECEGTGFIAVADDGGEGVEHVECGQHHPAFAACDRSQQSGRTQSSVSCPDGAKVQIGNHNIDDVGKWLAITR
jgi:hypothetical protein